jgi:hypothetical protein
VTVIVTMKHVRAAGYCSRAPRVWFAQRGLSWSDFVTNGISSATLEETGDGLALKVVDIAKADPDAERLP